METKGFFQFEIIIYVFMLFMTDFNTYVMDLRPL